MSEIDDYQGSVETIERWPETPAEIASAILNAPDGIVVAQVVPVDQTTHEGFGTINRLRA